jgi:putative nucleotidyltransferase with HDIG domain
MNYLNMLPPELQGIADSQDAFLVGGSVRDFLSGRQPDDYDIVVIKEPESFARQLAAKTKGAFVKLGKADMIVFRVVAHNIIFDISPPKGACLEDDLLRRDFTINALAADLSSGKLTDPTGGLSDMQHKLVRMVSAKSFTDDPLRLLRAFRMAAAFDFTIETQTLEAVKKYAPLISRSAGERIRAEMLKIFCQSDAYPYLVQMAETGLLFAIFPELSALKGCIQNHHHAYDAFNHTMSAFYHLEKNLKNADIGREQAALLKCAILLHDIGKPYTRTSDESGEVHFYGHEQKSADMFMAIAERLKFSNAEERFIEAVIRHHLKPLFLFQAEQKNALTSKAVTRFFMKYREYVPFLLLHATADHQGKGSNVSGNFIAFMTELADRFQTRFTPESRQPPLITGADLIREFKLNPSPLFKKILTMIEEERLSGNLENRQQAMARVKEILSDSI